MLRAGGRNRPPHFNTKAPSIRRLAHHAELERNKVTPAEIDSGADNAPAHGGRRHGQQGDKYAISFRRQFRAVTIFLLAVNLMIGLFARHQQHAIIDYAVTIYDTAFISTNYVSLAQIAFQHYVDDRFRAADTTQASEANAILVTVL